MTGLRVRGGCEVDIAWHGGKLVRATESGPVKVRYGKREGEIQAKAGGVYEVGYLGKP